MGKGERNNAARRGKSSKSNNKKQLAEARQSIASIKAQNSNEKHKNDNNDDGDYIPPPQKLSAKGGISLFIMQLYLIYLTNHVLRSWAVVEM
jgi:hypothetical protein